MNKVILNSLNIDELKNIVESLGEKPFRASQLYDWLYNKKVSNIDDMSNISKNFRLLLNETTKIRKAREVSRTVSKKDGCVKLLLELDDGCRIESVLLKDKDRITACISTQVGCKMGCLFCATAAIGFKRNLLAAEILEQVRIIEREAFELGYSDNARLDNIVVMGMGEPLDNMDNLLKALEILTDDLGYGYSHKRITVSTVGIADRIKYLFKLKFPVNLAVSLNASNQQIRQSIMPISKKYHISDIINAIKDLDIDKRDEITFEYVLIDGINDSGDCAYELVKLVKKLPVKMNLIKYNGGWASGLNPPSEKNILAFQKILTDNGVKAFIRKSLGADIFGACGQLAAGYNK